ncbi:hypothetical protein IscW_ISCW009707, partial [Ixodes scapularis]
KGLGTRKKRGPNCSSTDGADCARRRVTQPRALAPEPASATVEHGRHQRPERDWFWR